MKSYVTEDFTSCFERLPKAVKKRAQQSYGLWKKNPHYSSLHFKQVHSKDAVYSVRIGRRWRALGLVEGDAITWFWIGSPADYDKLLSAS